MKQLALVVLIFAANGCGGSEEAARPDGAVTSGDDAVIDAEPDAAGPGEQMPGPWPMPGQNPGATRRSPLDGPTVSATSGLVDVVSGATIVTAVEPVVCAGSRFAAAIHTAAGDRIVAFDATGATLWEHALTDEAAGLVCGPGSTLYVLGETWNGSRDHATAQLHALGADGSALWSSPFTESSAIGYRIGGTPDGAAIVVGEATIAKVSAGGSAVWQRTFPATRIGSWAVASDGGVRLAFTGAVFVKALTATGQDAWVYSASTVVGSVQVAIGDGDATIVAHAGLTSSMGWVARQVLLDSTGSEIWNKELRVPMNIYSNQVKHLTVNGLASCTHVRQDTSSNTSWWMYCYDAAGSAQPAYRIAGPAPVVDQRGHIYTLTATALAERDASLVDVGTRDLDRSYEWILPDASGSFLLVGASAIARLTSN
ncbi:MAG: hypothetical protein HOV81_08535 [Kofleriaceae bacterium]|nr:hypothetical protein [Kofleriaceae bacterium]